MDKIRVVEYIVMDKQLFPIFITNEHDVALKYQADQKKKGGVVYVIEADRAGTDDMLQEIEID